MKKKLSLFLALLLALTLALTACGAKNAGGMASDQAVWNGENGNAAPGSTGGSQEAAVESGGGDVWEDATESVGNAIKPQTSLAEKIIYSADVTVETVDFDKALESVDRLLEKYGAFLESSSVSGKSYAETYYGTQTYRKAQFVIRVPVTSFKDMTADMGTVGSVLQSSVYTDNITERYYDTQSRADSYRIEQERLMDMLEKCETVSEMIEIESRLSEVRYQLESLESTLRNWQNQVDYSTVNVTLREVQEYTKRVEVHRTYWQQIGDGLSNTMKNIGDFFKDVFKWLVVNLPTLLLLAAFLGAAAVVIAALVRRSRAKKARRESQNGGSDTE